MPERTAIWIPALGFLALSLLATPAAQAGDADAIAQEASEVNDASCADATSDEATRTADALVKVSDVYSRLAQIYAAAEEPRPDYLLYWRGVLGLCLGRDELATGDLRSFAEASEGDAGYATLRRDAMSRLRRIEAQAKGGPAPRDNPLVTVGLQGGWGRLGTDEGWNYGTVQLDASLRLRGPLSLAVSLGLGVSEPNTNGRGDPLLTVDGRPEYSVLTVIGVGPVLRFSGPVLPEVGVAFRIAPDPAGTAELPVLLGAALHGGLSIPLGESPLALRFGGDVGFLLQRPTLAAHGGLVVLLGS